MKCFVRVPRDHGDPLVAEIDEVLDRRGGATGVIDPDAREAVDTTTNHAHRDIKAAKGVDFRLGERQGDEQDAVHPLSEQAGGEIALAHLRIAYVVQQQVETGYHSGVATNLELSDADTSSDRA